MLREQHYLFNMCMIAGCVTKNFGVLATDSALYDSSKDRMYFQNMKLYCSDKYVVSYIGASDYFSEFDVSIFNLDYDELSDKLSKYLNEMRPKISGNKNVCVFVLGIKERVPTISQFNSYLDFDPKYLFSSNGPKFSTVYYGDDNKEKKKVFSDSKSFMDKEMKRFKKEGMSPGIVGEVLARGIYKKADLEMKTGEKRKYAGGAISTACILFNGSIFPLSGFIRV